jgi:hypothetical protein
MGSSCRTFREEPLARPCVFLTEPSTNHPKPYMRVPETRRAERRRSERHQKDAPAGFRGLPGRGPNDRRNISKSSIGRPEQTSPP